MLDNNEQNTENNEANNASNTQASSTNARRGFLKKAAIASPIVIATSATPAWGAACMSGIMSGNVSNHTQIPCNLSGGLSHGHWKNHHITKAQHNKYEHFYVKVGRKKYFSPFKTTDRLLGFNFINLLNMGGNYSYERELATALINASMPSSAGLNYPYSINDVNDIANQVYLDPSITDQVTDLLESIHINAAW